MITKSKLAHGAMTAEYQSRRPDLLSSLTNRAYLCLLLWVIFVALAPAGVAAFVFQVP